MKKIVLMLLVVNTLLLCACSTNSEETDPTYCSSNSQTYAVENVFNGTFADVQFSNLSETEHSYLLPDPDKIAFKITYKEPNRYNENYISSKMSEAHGECSYLAVNLDGSVIETECYYYVSCAVDEFCLYYKGGANDKTLYKRLGLSIKNESTFYLQDKAITLPYIFVKQ